MKPRTSISARNGPQDESSGGHDLVAELAKLLARLPPLNGTASYNGDDPKYKRLSLPTEYRGPVVKQFGSVYRVFFDPAGCLRLVPAGLGDLLFAEILNGIEDQERTARPADVEGNQKEVEMDAKGRLRLSCALTDPVGIEREVVFCCRRWWIEIWAKERRQLRLSNPHLSTVRSGETCLPTPARPPPKQQNCSATRNAIPGTWHRSETT